MPRFIHPSLSFTVSVASLTLVAACAESPAVSENYLFPGDWRPSPAPLDSVLTNYHQCNAAWAIRHQSLSAQQVAEACELMAQNEKTFHRLFKTHQVPVSHDYNHTMTANIYASAEEYQRHAGKDFGIDTNNGGMYLEGYPDWQANAANFIAYQRGDSIWNLRHEMVHYLDGRFNVYGDFCAGLHNNHAAPEYCPEPAPLLPHLTWWTEGVAEFVANGSHNPGALALAKNSPMPLSEIFNNTTESGTDRVYRWGYLAVRFMVEQQPTKVDQMLAFTRKGDFSRYQALVKGWGTSMDAEFSDWLSALN